MKILDKILEAKEKQLPFVAYKKPNENVITSFFQHTDELFYSKNYEESGFVFAPFNDDEPSILIPKSESEVFKEKINFSFNFSCNDIFLSSEEERENHIKTVDKAIKSIVNNEFKKVVISRQERVEVSNFNLIETFKKMIMLYPSTLVYVWFHPKVGLWLGATPETLIKITNNKFETMSLAGTQEYDKKTNVSWQHKELDEQQVVTDYIVKKIKPFCNSIQAKDTETIKAGSLLHLKTKITGSLSAHSSQLIKCLHPTPAVCGVPKDISKDFILNNENYKREFYTGFLGEINLSGKTFLFVNLRCMQIDKKIAIIYVGGGITQESNSIKEFEETVAKSRIMKRIL